MARFCELVADFSVSLSPVETQWLVRIVAPGGAVVVAQVCAESSEVSDLVYTWTTTLMSPDEVACPAGDLGALTVELRCRLSARTPATEVPACDELRAWFERQMGS